MQPMGSLGDTAAGGRRRHRRVLLLPLPFQGHIGPMFQLAGLLHSRGFAITVFHTQFNAPDVSLHPAYDFVWVVPNDGMPLAADAPDTVRVAAERMLALNRGCEAPFRERLAALLERQRTRRQDEDVACLVADTHLLTLAEVARGLGVPTLALRTGSAACLRWFAALPVLWDKLTASPPDAPVAELPPYRVRDLLRTSSGAAHHQLELVSRVATTAKTSSGLILNTLEALEADELASLRRDLSVPVFELGPLHKLSPAASSSLLRQDRGCLDWLDRQDPGSVLYISFGSVAVVLPSELVEMAWGIASSGRPFLWVLRPGLVYGGPLSQPPPLPDGFDAATRGRGAVVSWAPQEEVLAHPAVGGFWTHCGWNSTLEAVCAGVPMLCRPFFGDQMGNARYVEHVWRVGVTLDGELERGGVERAIAALMGPGEPCGELRRRARELKSRAAQSIAGEASLNVDRLVNHIMTLQYSV